MKSTHALIAAPALLVLGAFAGHELFPSEVEAPSKAATSVAPRSKAKLPRISSEPAGEVASPTYYHSNLGFNPWNNYGRWGGVNFSSISGAVGKLALKDLAAAESYAAGLKTPGERTSTKSSAINC